MPKVGDPVPLTMKLFDSDSSKHVRAIVTDSDGLTVAGSPFTLTHIGNGLYENTMLVMPNKAHVTASIQVFDDALFTIPSDTYTDGIDFFERVILDQDLIDCLDEIKNLANQILLDGQQPDVSAIIQDRSILAKVEQIAGLAAIVNENKLAATVRTGEQNINAVVTEENIQGEVS